MNCSFAKNLHRRFLDDETGGLTAESVLWVPIYGVFFALIADVSLAMNGKTQAQRVIQDINRLASYGYFGETDDFIDAAESRALATMSHISPNVDVSTTFDDTNNIITTVATIPASDLMPLGLLSAFADIEITVVSFHVMED